MAKIRVHMTMNANVVRLWQLAVPAGRRSSLLERLIAQWCIENYDKVKKGKVDAMDTLRERLRGSEAESRTRAPKP